LLGTRQFIFNFDIVKHAKTTDFWAHADEYQNLTGNTDEH